MRETWIRSLGWEGPRRRERLPTPVFWPGEFYGLYNPLGRKELDTTEQLSLSFSIFMKTIKASIYKVIVILRATLLAF